MIEVYSTEGLPFSTESDINQRQHIVDYLTEAVRNALIQQDPEWTMEQIQVPLLIPKEYLRIPYRDEHIYTVGDLRLRPETTEATYAYARQIDLKDKHCIWTHSRSARPEPGIKTPMHLHEFWQLEFQCFYKTADVDYQKGILEPLRAAVSHVIHKEARVVESEDTTPYSPCVMDVMVENGESWTEVASILIRNDSGIDGFTNLEIGFGTDRILIISNQ
jgi:hypothetical protein